MPRTCCPGLGLALRPGEVDQVELADADRRLAPVGVLLGALADDGEDGVAPRALLVHLGRPDAPVLLPALHHLVNLDRRLDDERGEVLHVYARVQVLLELKAVFRVLGEQVANLAPR